MSNQISVLVDDGPIMYPMSNSRTCQLSAVPARRRATWHTDPLKQAECATWHMRKSPLWRALY